MLKRFEYDLAFSFAEEDRLIAEAIAVGLKKKNFTNYYIYTEQEAKQWGKDLFQITLHVYRNSRFVLMICSADFVKGYWSGIEHKAMSSIKRIEGRILPLRTDETKLAGLPPAIIYKRWHNDAEEIAKFIISRIKADKKRERRMLLVFAGLVLGLVCVLYSVFSTDVGESCVSAGLVSPGTAIGIRWKGKQQLDAGNQPEDSTEKMFYLGNTEVTVEQYQEFCKETKSYFPPQPFPQLNNNPVVNVTWDEAFAFCKWKKGRLPTEEEWEYAASAGQNNKYSGGNNAAKVAVYGGLRKFKAVGGKCPNAFGLYDMSGNVAEWTSSTVPSLTQFKIVKGGTYKDQIAALQISVDSSQHHALRSSSIGFRIAWDQKPSN